MAVLRHIPRRFGTSARARVGVGIVLIASLILLAIGWLFWGKFTAPTPLARLLPASETYLFIDVKTNTRDANVRDLAAMYASKNITTADLLDLTSLGFVEADRFVATLGDRVGIAFFGEDFDPQQFALIADVGDADAIRAYLDGLALTGETMNKTTYHGITTYAYPRSRLNAFAFVGDDLIFAADDDTLHAVLDATTTHTPRVSEMNDYANVITHVDPRAPFFAYLSPAATRDFATEHFAGFDRALASGVSSLFAAGGLAGYPRDAGIDLTTFFATTPAIARAQSFVPVAPLASPFASFSSLKLTRWYIGDHLADALPKHLNTSMTLLLAGGLDRFVETMFGTKTTFAAVAPLLTGDVFWGERTDGAFLIAATPTDASAWTRFEEIIARGDGQLATHKIITLPDGTTGTRMIATPPTITTARGDVPMTTFDVGGGRVWTTATIGTTHLLASDAALLADAIDALAAGVATTAPLADTDDLFFTMMQPDATLPWLAPFTKLFIGRDADPSGLTVKLRLE